MLAGLGLLILIVSSLLIGISAGLAMGSLLQRIRRALSRLFAATVISLISILGFSGGSSILISGEGLILYIPISIIAALCSGLMSVAFSIAIEKMLRIKPAVWGARGFSGGLESGGLPKYILVAFVSSLSLGVLLGGDIDPGLMLLASQILLLILMLVVGIDLGLDPVTLRSSLSASMRCWYVWLGAIVGSTVSGLLILGLFGVRVSLISSLAMGWYTYIASYVYTSYGARDAIYAFLQNYFREVLTYVAIPLLSRSTRSASLIAFGGVTTMDNTLPAIVSYLGREYTFIAISSGIILTMIVPLIVPIVDGMW